MLLYNIFEWINMTSVKNYLSIILSTRFIGFTSLLEKRVKSRMNCPMFVLHRLKPEKVMQIIEARIDNFTRKHPHPDK